MEFPKQISYSSAFSVEDLDEAPSPAASLLSSGASLAERSYGSMSHAQPKLVRLNVGGTIFTTFSTTLTQAGKRSFFEALLCGRVPPLRDDSGAYFIDRNPEVFACLLDYLRSGKLYIPAQVNEKRLIDEFDFFGVDYPNVRYLDAEQLEYSYLWAVSATNQRGVLFEMQLCLSKMRGAEPVGYLTSKSSKTGLSEVLTNVVFSVTTRVVQFFRPALEEWYHGTVTLLRQDEDSLSLPARSQRSARSSQSPHRTVPCRTSLSGHFMCRDETRVASFGSWNGVEIDAPPRSH